MNKLTWPILAMGLLCSCASMNRVEHWPDRGSDVCVVNSTTEMYSVYAFDWAGRSILVVQHLRPNEHKHFRWPFIAANGYIQAGNFTSKFFNPWEASYWTWDISRFDAIKQQCK